MISGEESIDKLEIQKAIQNLNYDGSTSIEVSFLRESHLERTISYDPVEAIVESEAGAKAVYVNLNPFEGLVCRDSTVTGRRWLFIDVDRLDASGNATDDEIVELSAISWEVKNYLSDLGWPYPNTAVSGNGVHLLYRVAEPNDEATKQLFKAVLAKLHEQFPNVDKSTYNASRLIKLPGTWARKGIHSDVRPHRRAYITWACQNSVTREQLEALADIRPQAVPAANHGENGSVDRCAADMLTRTADMVDANDGSRRLFACACRAIEHNLDEAGYLAALDKYEEKQPFRREWSEAERLARYRDAARNSDVIAGSAWGAEYTLTDDGNGLRFWRDHGTDVAYCHSKSEVYLWDGRRWERDDSNRIRKLARKTVGTIYSEASNAPTDKRAKAIAKFANKSLSKTAIDNMIYEGKNHCTIEADLLNARPWLFNCANGTLDLKTGELRSHCRADYLTVISPTAYDVGADCDKWLRFMNDTFRGNGNLIGFVQRLLGVSLIGEIVEQILPIFYGTGANGKSVLIDTWCRVLGSDYAGAMAPGMLLASAKDRTANDVAELYGRRFVHDIEISSGRRFDEGLLKQITSGDRLTGRKLYQQYFEFAPSHTAVLVTNHKPIVGGGDYALWRRLKLVPFNHRVPEAKRRPMPELVDDLLTEAPGVLAWAVRGLQAYNQHGLAEPDEITSATKAYQSDEDIIAQFIAVKCVMGGEIRAGELYSAYREWAGENGHRPMSNQLFGRKIVEKGYEKRQDRRGTFYPNIQLSNDILDFLG